MSINSDVFGRVVQPELKFTCNGKAMWKARIAVNHRKKDQQSGEYQDSGTTWINVTLWEHQAEKASELIADKSFVIARGRLETREYQKQDGSTGYSFEMQVDQIGPAVPKFPPRNQPAQPRESFDAPAQQPVAAGGWGGAPAGDGWGNPTF